MFWFEGNSFQNIRKVILDFYGSEFGFSTLPVNEQDWGFGDFEAFFVGLVDCFYLNVVSVAVQIVNRDFQKVGGIAAKAACAVIKSQTQYRPGYSVGASADDFSCVGPTDCFAAFAVAAADDQVASLPRLGH